MKFRDFIKYIVNYKFILRILKGNIVYDVSFNYDFDYLDKFYDLTLKSVTASNDKLVISLIDD